MSIQPFAAGSYVSDRNTASLVALKSRLQTLSTQLATGSVANTYGGLGAGRSTSLSARATVSALDGYMSAITNASTRVKLVSASLTQLSTLTDTLRTGLISGVQSSTALGVTNTVTTARASFDAAIDALNQNFNGQYLFAGRASDTQPVVSSALMFDGDATVPLAGLKALIAEQQAADGVGGTGRLSTSAAGNVVTLDEDASAEARANFGFSILDVTSSNAAGISANLDKEDVVGGTLSFGQSPVEGARVRVAVILGDGSQKVIDLTALANASDDSTDSFKTDPSASVAATNLQKTLKNILGEDATIASIQSANPPSATLNFASAAGSKLDLTVGTPSAGDTVTIKLGMRDGTTTSITLTAGTGATSAGSFQLGATSAATATELNKAIELALKGAAQTELSGSSQSRAAQNFFDGSSSAGLAPRRVSGDGYAELSSTNTVIWYKGDDSSADARATASVQVGANRQIAIGAQANEAAIKATLAGFATLAIGGFADATGAQDTAKFAAAAKRAEVLLAPSDAQGGIPGMLSEFGVAAASMANAKTQAQATKTTLEDAIGGVENVSTEEVAAKLLTLQTQLQASYQVTSTLAKLTLVNYLG